MINEIDEKYDNSFKDIKPELGDTILCYNKNRILMRRTYDHLELPKFLSIINGRHLFDIGNRKFFHVEYEDLYNLDDSYEFIDIKTLRTIDETKGIDEREERFASITGYHYNYFIHHARFCGCCGEKMVESKVEMANVCPSCGNIKYPDIMPAIAVAIIYEDKILLTKYAGRKDSRYALVAGYLEIGETLEECVKRETFEEVGLDLYDIKYYMSQPWGFSDTIMVGFIARARHDKITLENKELGFADWFKAEDIPEVLNPTSMSHKIIEDFRTKKIK